MALKTHELNIPQIKACLNVYPEIWVHGDGNMFPVFVYNPNEPDAQDHSLNHSQNFNRGHEECSYRVKINRNNMPKSKAELDRLLTNAKMQEDILQTQQHIGKSKITNIQVNDSDFGGDVIEPAGDIDYSQYVKK